MDTSISCDITNLKDLELLERTTKSVGVDKSCNRPMYWFNKLHPYWYDEGIEYDETKHDPLASVFIIASDNSVIIDSGYRCLETDIKVTPDAMEAILYIIKAVKSNQ